MKKTHFYLIFLVTFISVSAFAAEQKTTQGRGEVVTVDPLYSRITIETGTVKGFSAAGKNEFVVSSNDLLKGLSARDLVEFELVDVKGDAKITKLKKTGLAPEKDSGTPLGKAVQEVLTGTGNVVKTVTSPIPVVHDTLGEAVGSTTEATGNLVSDIKSDAKKDF